MLVLFSLTGSRVVETGAGTYQKSIDALHILFERCSEKLSVGHCTIHLLVEVGQVRLSKGLKEKSSASFSRKPCPMLEERRQQVA